jgi:hypothetical protein
MNKIRSRVVSVHPATAAGTLAVYCQTFTMPCEHHICFAPNTVVVPNEDDVIDIWQRRRGEWVFWEESSTTTAIRVASDIMRQYIPCYADRMALLNSINRYIPSDETPFSQFIGQLKQKVEEDFANSTGVSHAEH